MDAYERVNFHFLMCFSMMKSRDSLAAFWERNHTRVAMMTSYSTPATTSVSAAAIALIQLVCHLTSEYLYCFAYLFHVSVNFFFPKVLCSSPPGFAVLRSCEIIYHKVCT